MYFRITLKIIPALLIITNVIFGCSTIPKKPETTEYLSCRKQAHEIYAQYIRNVNSDDYLQLIDYDSRLSVLYSDRGLSAEVDKRIGQSSCFAKLPNDDEKKWIEQYQLKEINAEKKFMLKKSIMALKPLLDKNENLRRENDRRFLFKEIGTQICKEEKSIRYTGYIEQVEPKKVKIRIAIAEYIGAKNMKPSGFMESVLWDFPENWYVCE